VGLWEKRDENNRAEDHIVVKQENEGMTRPFDPIRDPHLKPEAIIHRDMNKRQPGSFPKLRAYKHLEAYKNKRAGRIPSTPAVYRMYLEHCPHGDLDRLRKLYSIWDQPLPELFIWHVFLRLAIAGEALRAPPSEDSEWTRMMLRLVHDALKNIEQQNRQSTLAPRKKAKGKGRKKARKPMTPAEDDPDMTIDPTRLYRFNYYHLIHGDMKPANVLLGDNRRGYVPEEDRRNIDNPDYPLAKMSDFGLSRYITRDSPEENPNAFWGLGTDGFRAPVSLHH